MRQNLRTKEREYEQFLKKRRNIRKKALFRFIAFTFLLLTIGFLNKQNNELRSTIEQKDQDIAYMINIVGEMNEVIDNIDTQLVNVSSINESYVDELNELRNRSELYDKYEYAIVHNGARTSLTYEEIELGEELMLAKGLDPNMMFGSIMVESRANPEAVNKVSGATGYGQFLDGTAKWVWTTLLKNENYHSDLRKDGKSNILMMATYYDYLYKTTGSIFETIKSYSGNSTDSGTRTYISWINNYTRKVGSEIKF